MPSFRSPSDDRRDWHSGPGSWRDEFGWTQDKTYDAEYLAVADLLGCRLVTLDVRLRRGAERLGFVVTPAELADRPASSGLEPNES